MASKTKRTGAKPAARAAQPSVQARVASTLAWLERNGTKKTRDGMARYAIHADKAFGVTMAAMRVVAKRTGRDHALALALWDTGWYEARMLVAFVGDPARTTPAQMERFCRGFDSWALCDTLCFHLFDRTPHAFDKVVQWSKRSDEFQKRAAFALLASVALHDKAAGDAPFLRCLPLIERGASDPRNFVKKGVSWALRAIGGRSHALNGAALEVARRLSKSPEAAPRWVGKDAAKALSRRSAPAPAAPRRAARAGGGARTPARR